MKLSLQSWKITAVLAALGVVGGAVAAIVLTYLGRIISGAPQPASLRQYIWNIRIFATVGGVFTPIFAWGMLRNVPIWRIVVEPAIAGIASTVVCMLFVPTLFPVIAPSAMLAAMVRLNSRYPGHSELPARAQ
jgi:hypothetical protein